jgi:hypothetical protein
MESIDTFDMTVEQPLLLKDAAQILPKSSRGKKVNARTVERWIRHGHKGVRLQGCIFGRTIYTSRESLQRFTERLSRCSAPRRTKSQASKSHKQAKETLAKAGFKVGGRR